MVGAGILEILICCYKSKLVCFYLEVSDINQKSIQYTFSSSNTICGNLVYN